MEIRFIAFDLWESAAERRLPARAATFVLKDPGGTTVDIFPSLTLHREITVLARGWLPVRSDGLTALHQIVPSPGAFLTRIEDLRRDDEGRYEVQPARTRRIEDRALLLGGHDSYFHWLIAYLPRLLYALRCDEVGDRKILVSANLGPLQRETLELLGVDTARLIPVEDDEAVTMANVLVPALLIRDGVCHPLVRQLLREEYPATPGGQPRRLYIAAGGTAAGHLTNEPELERLLARWGFERHAIEGLGFQQQVDLFSNAEAVVSVHCNGLANLAFCEAGTRVIELFNPLYRPSTYYLLSQVGKLAYRDVAAGDAQPGPGGTAFGGTWTVDLDAVEQALLAQIGPEPNRDAVLP
jgi:capsular polysaccharide biosynthesis protein